MKTNKRHREFEIINDGFKNPGGFLSNERSPFDAHDYMLKIHKTNFSENTEGN